MKGNCYYCGCKPQFKAFRTRRLRSGSIVNGIDRLNSKIGYIEVNCVSCCTACNYAKRDMDADQFIELCKKVAENRRETNAYSFTIGIEQGERPWQ